MEGIHSDHLRWGIVGTGGIATRFARELATVPDARLTAVASRSSERAGAFLADWARDGRGHAGAAALAADDGVDVVYVASPHTCHADDAVACLTGGKHVLCEKPLTTSEAEGARMADAARGNDRFLMEAMWTRFLPTTRRFLALAEEAAGADPAHAHIDFTFHPGVPPTHRLRDPHLAGGALLDVGSYALSLARWLLGDPDECASLWRPDPETGVDAGAAILLQSGVRQATVRIGMDGYGPRTATWTTPRGRVVLGPNWHGSNAPLRTEAPPASSPGALRDASVAVADELPGFVHQIREVHACLREGRGESPSLPLDHSLGVLRTMDRLRRAWGLVFPFEASAAPRR